MPKKQRTKQSDYLRFRPYHAFASPAADPANVARRPWLWWTVLIVGALALLVAGAVWLCCR